MSRSPDWSRSHTPSHDRGRRDLSPPSSPNATRHAYSNRSLKTSPSVPSRSRGLMGGAKPSSQREIKGARRSNSGHTLPCSLSSCALQIIPVYSLLSPGPIRSQSARPRAKASKTKKRVDNGRKKKTKQKNGTKALSARSKRSSRSNTRPLTKTSSTLPSRAGSTVQKNSHLSLLKQRASAGRGGLPRSLNELNLDNEEDLKLLLDNFNWLFYRHPEAVGHQEEAFRLPRQDLSQSDGT